VEAEAAAGFYCCKGRKARENRRSRLGASGSFALVSTGLRAKKRIGENENTAFLYFWLAYF
jgi:hypothetical protein